MRPIVKQRQLPDHIAFAQSRQGPGIFSVVAESNLDLALENQVGGIADIAFLEDDVVLFEDLVLKGGFILSVIG